MEDDGACSTSTDIGEAQFKKGELALCFYNAVLYDVKCMNIEKISGVWEIKVHYMNFPRHYDSFVNQINVLKRTPANLAKKSELETYNKKFLSRKQLSSIKGGRRVSKGNILNLNLDSQYKTLELPDELIKWLSFDRHQVQDNGRHLLTPARFSVINILNDYYAYQQNIVVAFKCVLLRDFVLSLEKLFAQAVTNLVYESERNTHEQNSDKSDHSLCEHYGSFHFLRLLRMISDEYSEIVPKGDEEFFWDQLDDLIKYLVNNEVELFSDTDYSPV